MLTFLIVVFMFVVPSVLSVFLLALTIQTSLWFIPLLLLSLFWLVFSFADCFKRVSGDSFLAIERFGEKRITKGPGIRVVIIWADKVVLRIKTSTYKLELFKKPIKIDFTDGSATPQGGAVYVTLYSPGEPYSVEDVLGDIPEDMFDKEKDTVKMSGVERAKYGPDEWETSIVDIIENATRSYLNGLAIDEALKAGKAGFDIANHFPKEEPIRIKVILLRWGFTLERVTISDFDLEKNIVDARGKIQEAETKKKSAKDTTYAEAYEVMGKYLSMIAVSVGLEVEDIQIMIRENSELLAQVIKFTEKLTIVSMTSESGSLIHTMNEGSDKAVSSDILEMARMIQVVLKKKEKTK